MLNKGAWEQVNIDKLSSQQRRSIIRSSIFLNEKYTSAGNFDKLKARLVHSGHMEDKSLYDDVSSLTATTTSVMIIAVLVAKECCHSRHRWNLFKRWDEVFDRSYEASPYFVRNTGTTWSQLFELFVNQCNLSGED